VLNTTYQTAIGIPPYLIIFGSPARPLLAALEQRQPTAVPDPTAT
jgi:hypothetical protein